MGGKLRTSRHYPHVVGCGFTFVMQLAEAYGVWPKVLRMVAVTAISKRAPISFPKMCEQSGYLLPFMAFGVRWGSDNLPHGWHKFSPTIYWEEFRIGRPSNLNCHYHWISMKIISGMTPLQSLLVELYKCFDLYYLN